MEKIKDCYGTTLQPGDQVVTSVSYGSDAWGWDKERDKIGSGIVLCTISHMSKTGSGRVMLKQNSNGWGLQRWPGQTRKV